MGCMTAKRTEKEKVFRDVHTVEAESQPDGSLQYRKNLKEIAALVLAAFGVSLLLNGCAWLVYKILGRRTGFDLAVEQLFHYPKSVSGVLAFFAAVVFLLGVTIFFEGWRPAEWARRWVVVPALGVAEHMLALVTGVFLAFAVIEPLPTYTLLDIRGRLGLVLPPAFLLIALATMCSAAITFFESDFEVLRRKWGKVFFLATAAIAIGLGMAAYHDLLGMASSIELPHR